MHLLKPQFFDSFPDLKEKYGKMVGLWMGPRRAVIINDYKLIVEAGQRDELIYRPPNDSLKKLQGEVFGETPGILIGSGQNWQEQRRFTLHCLRDLVSYLFSQLIKYCT